MLQVNDPLKSPDEVVYCDFCGKPIEDWRLVPESEFQPMREEGWSPCHPQGPVITRPVKLVK